jgi:mannose-1-phosphate guanylyltransferase
VKAVLLAAGLGTRLRPLTDTTPKCMLLIDDRPLVDIWLDELYRAGADEVLVNMHHLPAVVSRHLAARVAPPAVREFLEPELLGSAGTLLANRDWLASDDMFLACYADNLTDFDLRTLVDEHERRGGLATLAVFRSDQPWAGGVVEVDDGGVVVSFAEKPANPVSNLVNAGLYAFSPAVLDELSGPLPLDIGYHLLPRLVGRSRAVPVPGYFRDIGTLDSYRLAKAEWPVRAAR